MSLAVRVQEPIEVFHRGQLIGRLVRGKDGTWWMTLSGRLTTTLGPMWDREALIRRAVRMWHRHNRLP